mmetsp:Transcript_17153/g.14096  ORF Transcript_17153/g.14096 Transcript_17153/m.14096 type:complete len:110 (-) Transcript_17153:1518-1847(-)
MKNLTNNIKTVFNNAFNLAYNLDEVLQIQFNSKEIQGDFQCVDTVKIYQKYKGKPGLNGSTSPKDFAEQIVIHIEENDYFEVKNLNLSGPGFINLFIKDEFIKNEINRL